MPFDSLSWLWLAESSRQWNESPLFKSSGCFQNISEWDDRDRCCGTRGASWSLRPKSCSTPYRCRVALAEPRLCRDQSVSWLSRELTTPQSWGRPAGPAQATHLVARQRWCSRIGLIILRVTAGTIDNIDEAIVPSLDTTPLPHTEQSFPMAIRRLSSSYSLLGKRRSKISLHAQWWTGLKNGQLFPIKEWW